MDKNIRRKRERTEEEEGCHGTARAPSVGGGDKLSCVLGVLRKHAPAFVREIEGLSQSGSVEEIRVRRFGRSSVRISGTDVPLTERFGASTDGLLLDVSGGSPFAHRGSIADGYVTMACGARVGIIGRASYDGGLIGIRDISTLVFRIPGGECSFAEKLYRSWHIAGRGGALIISPPAAGKTTALAGLLGEIAKRDGSRIVLIDERCETDREALSSLGVDVMCGYKRASGMEIAVRAASPDIIACDEIYSESDAAAVMAAHGTGVRIIASAHARDRSELMKREVLARPIEAGVFGILFTVRRVGAEFSFSAERL